MRYSINIFMSAKIFEQERALVSAGLKEEQAKAILTVFADQGTRDVTKHDLEAMESRLKVWVLQTVIAQTAVLVAALVALVKI